MYEMAFVCRRLQFLMFDLRPARISSALRNRKAVVYMTYNAKIFGILFNKQIFIDFFLFGGSIYDNGLVFAAYVMISSRFNRISVTEIKNE